MTGKFLKLLFAGFVLHILLSLFFIVWPTFLPENWFSKIYKTYLLPGPFFRDDRITTSYNITQQTRQEGQWSEPVNHSKKIFEQYYENLNPTYLYKSRYSRAMDHVSFLDPLIKGKISETDSVRTVVTREYVHDYKIEVDTLFPVKP